MTDARARAATFSTFILRLTSIVCLLIAITFATGCNGDSGGGTPSQPGIVHFVPNSHAFWSDPANWTTSFGPAYANIVVTSSNFLPCLGGPYALCYYSGPTGGSEDLSCKLTPDGKYANCNCFNIPFGVFFVDINAILNHSIYEKTVAACGSDGSLCTTENSAPVCQSINQGTLIPGTNLFSTFSFDCIPENGLGDTNCTQAPYAGCMTAPCFKTRQPGIVNCSCPVFDGIFQVGQNDEACSLGDGLVWSASNAPPSATTMAPRTAPPATIDRLDAFIATAPAASAPSKKAGITFVSSAPTNPVMPAAVPSPGTCMPDAPGGVGCPLFCSWHHRVAAR